MRRVGYYYYYCYYYYYYYYYCYYYYCYYYYYYYYYLSFFCISVFLCCLLEASTRCRELPLYSYSSAVHVSSRSYGAFGASAPAPSAPLAE